MKKNNSKFSHTNYYLINEYSKPYGLVKVKKELSYNKLMNSTIADIQNINYVGGAGSITAAQFLQRFILHKTPWAHLDIAGMAFSKKAANLNPGGATGFGVRLLNHLVKVNYE